MKLNKKKLHDFLIDNKFELALSMHKAFYVPKRKNLLSKIYWKISMMGGNQWMGVIEKAIDTFCDKLEEKYN